jgi:hypothetical protein
LSVRSSVGLASNALGGLECACAAKGEALVGELLPELAPRERFVAVAGAACHLEPLTFRLASNVASGRGTDLRCCRSNTLAFLDRVGRG